MSIGSLVFLLSLQSPAWAPGCAAGCDVSFPTEDGGRVAALSLGQGRHAVVLVPGGRFTRESWHDQSNRLAVRGFRVLAIALRGRGKTLPGSDPNGHRFDVLAAVRHARQTGAKTVTVIGASWAAG